jgi:hypothetical protein
MRKNEQEICEKQLRTDFLKALQSNKSEDVVDDLINIIKKDYVLLLRQPLYCGDCMHCKPTGFMGWTHNGSDAYCSYHQIRITTWGLSNNCKEYTDGGEYARRTMARFHNNLTGDLFYD